jgi:O-antigen/teichoic acid export membrane protein
VVQFFNFLWLLFDLGTSAAFIKFFAQYRVHDPRRAIQYGQVFVWWQALSGALQVAAVTAVAGTLLPRTPYALYTWSIIIHTFIQIPGFYQVMRHGLMAWQRFDYAQILDIALALIFPMLTQPVLVTLMVRWGAAHPIFGGPMGGVLGMGMAAYAAELLSFLVGLWLYRRLGYNARLLFLAHFDWAIVKESFRFGVFEMLGSIAWAAGQALEILITQTRLVNYNEVWGNWTLAQNFIFSYNVLNTLYSNLMSSISEAISNARKVLSQYYSVMAYKWGGIMSAFIGAVLLAVADRFILGASGPEFVRAAAYAIPLIIWGAIQYPSWVGDNVQLGANRPYLKSILVAGEQVIRIVLALILLRRYQINALIFAYFVGLLTKDIVAYFVNDRLCFPQRFYFWQSLGAPLLAGAAHYLVLRWLTGLIWRGDQITSVLIFFIGILPSFPLFAFFYALFGGWDEETLAEVRHAVNLTGFVRPLAWLFWGASALGARLSPLHGRFPITIRPTALEEARALTEERVKLI